MTDLTFRAPSLSAWNTFVVSQGWDNNRYVAIQPRADLIFHVRLHGPMAAADLKLVGNTHRSHARDDFVAGAASDTEVIERIEGIFDSEGNQTGTEVRASAVVSQRIKGGMILLGDPDTGALDPVLLNHGWA